MSRIVSTAAVLLLAAPCFAADPPPSPVPTPKGEQVEAPPPADEGPSKEEVQAKRDALKVFIGRWTCTGTANTATQADAPFSATLKVEPTLDKTWLRVTFDQTKPKGDPQPMHAEELWGFDVDAGEFRRLSAMKSGRSGMGTSAGWLGDRFDWMIESSGGKPMRAKSAWTKKSDKELTLTTAVATGAEELHVVMEAVCKK